MKKPELRLSHIHWRVNNIKKAVKDIERLGFKVEWGRDPRYSPNAFIWFNDDAFIEVFTTLRPLIITAPIMGILYGKGMRERWILWNKRKEGLIDFAVEAKYPDEGKMDFLENIKEKLNECGIEISKIMNGTRKNVRGEKVGFGFCGALPTGLPFLVSAFTIPQIPPKIEHPNGIKWIKYIEIECEAGLIEKMKIMTCNDEKIIIYLEKETKILGIAFEEGKIEWNQEKLHGLIIDNGKKS